MSEEENTELNRFDLEGKVILALTEVTYKVK